MKNIIIIDKNVFVRCSGCGRFIKRKFLFGTLHICTESDVPTGFGSGNITGFGTSSPNDFKKE